MLTLGIDAAFHDCAAALVEDGVVVAAAEEERFPHVAHGRRPVPCTTWQSPFHAIDDGLSTRDARPADVDRVAYSFDPEAPRPLYLASVAAFALERLATTSHRARRVLEMLVASPPLPLLSTYRRLRGALRYRVAFL